MQKLLLFIFCLSLLITSPVYARTSQEEIANTRKEAYNQKLQTYSPENQKKIERFNKKITEFNYQKTLDLNAITVKQGEILDEYVRRIGYEEEGGADGINRNTNRPVENARYWITFAHEAVAFQAAKVYLINLSSESNIKSDVRSSVNLLESDLATARTKVLNSQKLVEQLIANE